MAEHKKSNTSVPPSPAQLCAPPSPEEKAKGGAKINEVGAILGGFPLLPTSRLKFSFCTCGGIPATPPVDLGEIEANRRAVQLAAAYGLEYRRGADLTRLSRYVYPYLEGEDFVFANNWHCCLWVLDNYFDGTDAALEEKLGLIRRLHAELEKIASKPGGEVAKETERTPSLTPPEPPPGAKPGEPRRHPERRAAAFVGLLGAALQPVLRRLGPRFQQHMVAQVADYLRGVEDHLLCDEDAVTLDEYAAIRAADSAYETVWPLMYLGLGDLLDLGEAYARGLRRRANQCGRIINDVYSVPKDRAAGIRFNAVFVLARELGISEAQAEKILVARANKLFRELPSTGQFAGFRLWCAGAAVWHDGAERYRAPTAGGASKTEAEQGAAPAKRQTLAAVMLSASACPEAPWTEQSPSIEKTASDGEYSGKN